MWPHESTNHAIQLVQLMCHSIAMRWHDFESSFKVSERKAHDIRIKKGATIQRYSGCQSKGLVCTRRVHTEGSKRGRRIIGSQCLAKSKTSGCCDIEDWSASFSITSGPSLGTRGSASAGSQPAGLVLDTWPFGVQIEAQESIKRAPF